MILTLRNIYLVTMNRLLYFILFLTLYFPFSGNLTQAQNLKDYTFTEIFSLRNTLKKGNNAHITYSIENGNLRHVYGPEVNHRYGAYISSVYPLGATRIAGQAGYTRYYRKKQQYSGMFYPASPLLTFADTLPGDQRGEIYHLAGNVIHTFSTHWSAGLTAGYLAGNNAKDTDPRNKNDLNQITIAPKVQYHTGPLQIEIKLLGLYGRETVGYKSFGNEIKNGVTFYPLWFYTTESFADGLNTQRNYRNGFYKADLDIRYNSENWGTTFRPSYSQNNYHIWINPSTKQSAGEITENKFHLENTIRIATLRYIHLFTPHFSYSQHKVYDIQQQLSIDNRIYETILKIKRAEVNRIFTGFYYIISPSSHPDKAIKASLEYRKRSSLFRLPPTDFKQEIRLFNFSASYVRSFMLFGKSLISDLQANYSTGNGTQPDLSLLNDKTFFHTQRHLLEREFQYLTASILSVSIKLKYIFPLNGNETDFYLEAQNLFHTTCNTSGWSARANTFTFSAGILF